jgi:hypothetical protein
MMVTRLHFKMNFTSKKDLTDWAMDQFNKYGIRQPGTYTEQELIDLNPTVPVDFIKQHVRDRDE